MAARRPTKRARQSGDEVVRGLWCPPPDLQQGRVAQNEAFFRGANEHAMHERERMPLGTSPRAGQQRFVCECADDGCVEIVHVTADEYRAVRSHPLRFLVRRGHQIETLERVVAQNDGYLIVEKFEDPEP